jgi:RimJ/RimL family protein N-acetyltransferase
MDQFELELIPIRKTLDENKEFAIHPDCQDGLSMTIDYYEKIGFVIPWIGYYASIDDVLVGSAGFKGKPVNGRVEIAYGTFPRFRKRGVGTAICKRMVQLSLITDPGIRICARTFTEDNYSSKILKRNDFKLLGTVIDDEDGEVWEWEFRGVDVLMC